MKYALLAFALVIGMYVGTVGTGDGPALIDSLSGTPRLGVLLLLGLVLYGSLWLAAGRTARYWKSGDPPTVIYVDEPTREERQGYDRARTGDRPAVRPGDR